MALIVPSLYWRLGAEDGLTDRSGNGRNGIAEGNILVGGEAGAIYTDADEATNFDGVDDRITSNYSTRQQLCTNPRGGAGATTGWQVAVDSTIEARSDITGHGLGFNTGFEMTAAAGQGGVRIDAAVTSGRNYRFSLYVQLGSVSTTGIRLSIRDAGGVVKATGATFTTEGEWTRLDLSVLADSTGDWRFRLDQVGAGSVLARFSGVLIEETGVPAVRAYFDGSSTDAGWHGAAHNSISDQGVFANGTTRTFEGWAWRDVAGVQHALVGGGGSANFGVDLTAADEVRFKSLATGSPTLWANAWPGTGRWVHWVVVFDEPADTVSLYINGRLVSSQAHTDQWGGTADPPSGPPGLGVFQIGMAGGSSAPFDGKLDEIAVYGAALTPAEILAHYKAGAPGITAGATPKQAKLRVVAIRDGGAGQGHELTDRISGLRYSSVRPGGDESCNFVLHQRWAASVPEIAKGNLLRVMDGIDVLWQGRIEEQDRGGDSDETIAVTAYGLGARAKDSTFTEVFVDHDLSAWGEVSAQRKIDRRALNITPERNLTVEPDEANGAPRLSMLVGGQFDDTTAEALYDAGEDNEIARLYVGAVSRVGLLADASLTAVPAAWADDNAGSEETGADYESASSITFDPGTPRRYIVLRWDWNGAGPAGADGLDYGFRYGGIALYGPHGLEGQDSPTATRGVGFHASQIITNIVGRVAGITVRRVDETGHVIYQSAYKAPTVHEDAIVETNRFHAHERSWGTWPPDSPLDTSTDGQFDYVTLQPAEQHWFATRAQCDDVDLHTELSTLFNAVDVHYTDESGKGRVVTRTRAVPELEEQDITRTARLDGGTMTTEAAQVLGDVFLALSGGFAPARGSVQLSQQIRHHTRGALAPHYMRADGSNLRLPDVLPSETLFELDSDPDRRTTFPVRRVDVDASGPKIQVRVDLDQTNDVLSALQARLELTSELIAG